MQKLFVRRGMTWATWHVAIFDPSPYARTRRLSGFDGLLRYWRDHSDLCDAVVRGAGLPTLALDPRGGSCEERRRAIAGLVGFAPVADAPWTEAQLERFRGSTARAPAGSPSRREDGGLVLDGLLWPGNRLLPVRPRRGGSRVLALPAHLSGSGRRGLGHADRRADGRPAARRGDLREAAAGGLTAPAAGASNGPAANAARHRRTPCIRARRVSCWPSSPWPCWSRRARAPSRSRGSTRSASSSR